MATEYKFNPSYIERLVEDHKKEVKDANRGKFLDVALRVVKNRLDEDPLRYRDYGPYWWALKKILIAHGVYDFDIVDETIAKEYSFDTEEKTITAADEFRTAYLNTFLIYTNKFDLGLEDGDNEPWLLSDPDMERLAVFKDQE